MNPEEKALFERMLKVTEDNNRLLKTMEKRGRWMVIWGVVKIVIFILPFVAGYILLQPYFGQAAQNLDQFKDLLNQI
jgi:hypothetical protein